MRAVQDPTERICRLDAAIESQVQSWSRLPLVRALMCFRGLALLNATTLVCELGQFTRFDSARALMSFVGLTPSEDSSGKRRRQGAITKSGNSAARRALVEAAWQYRLPARISPHLRKRQHDQPRTGSRRRLHWVRQAIRRQPERPGEPDRPNSSFPPRT